MAIIAAGWGAYSNSFRGRFVIDDHDQIVSSPRVRRLGWYRRAARDENGNVVRGPDGEPRREFSWPALANARPVVTMSLAANFALGRWARQKLGWKTGPLDVRGYHAVNLAVHVLAALVLFGVVRRTLRRPRLRRHVAPAGTAIALATTLIWVVHPLNTGAVTYVIQRAEAMMGLFYLLTVYCAIRAFSRRGWRAAVWTVPACISAAAGVGCKEVIATVPLVVLAYDRVFAARSFRRLLRRRWPLHAALPILTWGLIALRLVLRPPGETAGFEGAGAAGKITASWEYLSTQFGVVAHYLKLSLWPAGLNIDYWWPAAQGFGAIFWPGLLIGLLAALTAIALWRRPALGFAGLWFFLILAPSSSVMPIRDRAFEHRMYLSLAAVICLSAAAAWWLGRALLRPAIESPARRLRAGIGIGSAATLAAAGLLGLLTWRRNQLYHDDRALYQDIVDKAPHNPRGHRNLGVALVTQGRTRQALVHLRKSIDLYYDSHQAHNNYGAAMERLGDLPTAVKHYRIAVKMAPKYLAAHNNLGAALSRTGDYVGAMKHFRAVMRLAPDEATPYLQIGIIMANLGRKARAETYFKEATRRAPRLAKAWYNLGVVALEGGDVPRALSHFGTAVACDPTSAEARYNLGMTLWMARRPAEALTQFRAILTPGRADPMALNAVAGILSTYPDASVRNGAEAVRIAEKLCRDTNHGNAAYLSTLAGAYAESGRFSQAVLTMQQAVSLARRAGAARSVRRFEARLRALRAGRPLRYVPAPSVGVARKLPTSD